MKSFPKIAVLLALFWFSLSGQIVSAESTQTVAPETKPTVETKEMREKLPHSYLHGLWDTNVHVRLPPLDLDEIQAEDAKRDVQEKALRIGVVRQLPLKVVLSEGKSNLGTWKELPDGSHVWILTIEAPNAIGIRVHIEGLTMSKQCEIVAYNTLDPSQLRGPYTDRSLGGRSEFWTGTIFSESVTVEYYCPPDDYKNKIELTVDQIIHIY